MCFFLCTHCAGRRCALPPAPPHLLLFFSRLPLLPTLIFFISSKRGLFRFILPFLLLIFINIHRDCLCASFLHCGGRRCTLPPAPPHPLLSLTSPLCYLLFFVFVSSIVYLGSSYLYWYPSILVPMYFFLGTHCGGRDVAPSPMHPTTRFYF